MERAAGVEWNPAGKVRKTTSSRGITKLGVGAHKFLCDGSRWRRLYVSEVRDLKGAEADTEVAGTDVAREELRGEREVLRAVRMLVADFTQQL